MKKEAKKFPVNFLDRENDYYFSKLYGTPLPEGCLDLGTYIISELFANVKEHSMAKQVTAEFSISNSLFFFSVSDNGIGIRNSFLKNGIFAKDDRTAIQLATGGLSTKKKNERAFGLYSIERLVEKSGGTLTIITGKSFAKYSKNQLSFGDVKKQIKGVKLAVKIPLKKINVYDVLN